MPSIPCASVATGKYLLVTSHLVVAFFLLVLSCIRSLNYVEFLGPRAVHTVSDVIQVGYIEKKEYAKTIGFNHSGFPIPANLGNIGSVHNGHWEYVQDATPPYIFSQEMCMASFLDRNDCNAEKCHSNLMNWVYIDHRNNAPYPKFDVDGFRRNTRNSCIIFVGSSLARQQFQALVWTLGHDRVEEQTFECSRSWCIHDAKSNATICHRFMGFMSTRVYREGNFKLNRPLLGAHLSDQSCLLHDNMIDELVKFDLVFVQGSIAWFSGLPLKLNSTSSPDQWVAKMLPLVYYDAMDALLSKISQQTKTVFVLGQTGTSCANKSAPEPFNLGDIPGTYHWNLGPKLWDASLTLIREKEMNVQVIDVREPLMQSVQAHPEQDCLHFCLNSSAINIYLDMYWVEVFSTYMK